MVTVREPQPHPQARAVEIVAEAIRVLRTRDGFDIPDELVVERARNAVTALSGAFFLLPHEDERPDPAGPFALLASAAAHLAAVEVRLLAAVEGVCR